MADLFTWEDHVDQRTVRARTLLVTLGSFVDAGHVQRQLDAHLRNVCPSHRLGSFDVDSLIDYRDQRPVITFDRDHFQDYQTPVMELSELTDAHGEKFLLLSGLEPAFRWEAMAREIRRIVVALGVELVVMMHGIPMMASHTRPTAITRHATDPALLPGNQPMFGTIVMAAAFQSMLAVRLGEAGHDAVGLTAHVPHYLAQTDYPDAALALLQALRDVSGLHVPTSELAVAAGVVRAQLAEHLAENEEFAGVVDALESAQDEAGPQPVLEAGEPDLPSADEIGAEAETFLRRHGDNPDDAPPSV